MEDARVEAVKRMEVAGVSSGLANEMVEQALATLQEPADAVEAVKELNAEDMVMKMKEELRNMTAANTLIYVAFFLKGRFVPQWDIASDLLVIIGLCHTVPEGGVPWIDANGSFSKPRPPSLC